MKSLLEFQAEEKLSVKTAELLAREEEIAALREDVAKQKRVDERLRKNLKETRAELSKCQDGLESQADVVRGLRVDVEEKEGEIVVARAKIEELQSEVAERSGEVEAREGELERATETVAKLEGDKARLRGAVSEAKRRIGGMTQSSLAQKIKVREKSEEVATLQQRLNKNLGCMKKLQVKKMTTTLYLATCKFL